jgi:hypothetical protein
MAKYRKKPVVIDAVQYIKGKTSIKDIYNELRVPISVGIPLRFTTEGLFIETLEGLMRVSDGDYIIKGINGEIYPCKQDVFEKTYEKVAD